jgi:nitrogen PTS system EIIA component
MKFSDFIVKQAIRPALAASDRDGALAELVGALADAGAIPKSSVEEIVGALVKREKSGSTGLGKGVAVPHVKHAKIKTMVGTFGRSVGGIDFAALDKQPVYTMVLVLSPENQPQQHLQAMNTIVTSLQNDMFRKFLRQSDTQDSIAELLDEADQGK